MDWWVVLQIIIGALATVGIVVFVEYFRKPKLKLKIADPVDVNYANRPASSARYLGLMVENRPLPRKVRWLSRNTAIRCQGLITFHHLDGQNTFGRSMQARWSGSPEPVPIYAVLRGASPGRIDIYDPIRLSPEIHRDIYTGESEKLDVAARFDNDVDCYGWCNDNYFSDPRWRNPNWRLNTGQYLVKVEVRTAGQRCEGLFRLVNDVPINDFRLLLALPDDYAKVLKTRK